MSVLVWAGVNFPHWYQAEIFCLSWEHADNPGVFSLLPSKAHPVPRPFLLHTQLQGGAGTGARAQEGAQQGQLIPADPKDIPSQMASCSAYKAGGRRRKGGHLE